MKLDAKECLNLTGKAYVPHMAGLPAGTGLARDGGWIALTGGPIGSLNMASIEDGPWAEECLREFTRAISVTGHPAIILMPETLAARVAPQAKCLGLERADPLPLMAAHLEAKPTFEAVGGGFAVARVRDEEALAVTLALQAETFAMPIDALRRAMGPAIFDSPVFDIFLATRGGVPFSTVTTATVDGVTSLWAMATPPAKQRQGAGRATFLAALAFHQERGIQRFFLGASPAGRPLYERCGFTHIGDTAMWVHDGSAR